MPEPARLEALIKGRRSVRRYTGRDVPSALIDELLDIASHAPTGVNARSVLFTVVREGAVMKTLRAEVMAQLVQMADEGKIPGGLVGQYIGSAVNAWKEDRGNNAILLGTREMLRGLLAPGGGKGWVARPARWSFSF